MKVLFNSVYFSVFLVITGFTYISAQVNSGTVKFKHTTYFEYENMPADMPKSHDTYMTLTFNNNESLYEKDKEVKTENTENDNTPRMFRRMRDRSNKTIYKEVNSNILLEHIEFFGKEFLVSDSIADIKWKVSAGEQKVILGFTCMKASYKDSTTNIIVFFTPQIPLRYGPDKFGNLPGIILEVQSAQMHILATDFIKNNPEIKKPEKGDKLTRKEFDKIRNEKMQEQREMWGRRGGEVRIIRQ